MIRETIRGFALLVLAGACATAPMPPVHRAGWEDVGAALDCTNWKR